MQPSSVDWELAARLASRAVRPGPSATRAERAELVEGLHRAAETAVPHVARITRLDPPGAADVRVVDRSRWARASVSAVRDMVRIGGGADDPASALAGVRGTVDAAQIAGVLALLSGAVLGQLDPWGRHGPRPGAEPGPDDVAPTGGTLLLVAPTVLGVQRSLAVPPADFWLWVALHEQTHAQQLAAAPWLAEHLARRAVGLLRDPEQTAMDELGAVMALLEGHADVTMDAVGARVVPSVWVLRRRFSARRDSGARANGLRRVLRQALGLDAKLSQYRDGAAFVRAVRRRGGTAALNAVWSGPDLLPTAAEIADPAVWLRRVHG
ncbi:MAG TPA: zinc-dependent metalloprotease [Cellulomonas sp.]